MDSYIALNDIKLSLIFFVVVDNALAVHWHSVCVGIDPASYVFFFNVPLLRFVIRDYWADFQNFETAIVYNLRQTKIARCMLTDHLDDLIDIVGEALQCHDPKILESI